MPACDGTGWGASLMRVLFFDPNSLTPTPPPILCPPPVSLGAFFVFFHFFLAFESRLQRNARYPKPKGGGSGRTASLLDISSTCTYVRVACGGDPGPGRLHLSFVHRQLTNT